MKQIRIITYYLLFIYNFFFKYFVNSANDHCVPPKFTAKNQESDTAFNCYDSVEECKSNQYLYYNSFELKCWKNGCPGEFYTNEMNSRNEPSEDISKNTCVRSCGQNFPKYKDGSNICKKNCDTGEVCTIDEPHKCKTLTTTIKNNYPYVSEKDLNLYIKECHYEKFIYTNAEGKKICVSNCKEYNKYFILGEQTCLNGCNSTYPYVNRYNQCLKICTDNNDTDYTYSDYTLTIPRNCLKDSGINWSSKCYYESNKIIYDRSSQKFFSKSNTKICYPICNREYITKIGTSNTYYCIPSCLADEYKKTTTIDNNNYKECVTSCSYRINGRDECISECPANYLEYTESGQKICYDANCQGTQKYNTVLKQCTNIPNDNYKYKYDSSLKLYIWVEKCIGTTQYIKDDNDKECVSSCSEGNNYIKGTTEDIQCLKSCGSEYYIQDGTKYYCKGNSCPSSYFTFIDKNGHR